MINPIGEHTPEAWVRAVTRMLWRIVLTAAVMAGTIYALSRLKAVLAAIIVAVALAYIIRPLAGFLMRQGWLGKTYEGMANAVRALARLWRKNSVEDKRKPSVHGLRALATIVVVVLMFFLGYLGLRIIINPFIQEAGHLAKTFPQLQDKWNQQSEDIEDWYNRTVPEGTRKWIKDQWSNPKGAGVDYGAKATEYGQVALRAVAGVLSNIVEIVLLPVLAFYFALDSRKLKKEFVSVLPRRHHREVLRMIHCFNGIMYSYVVGQAILCAIAGIVVGLGLWALGMDYWLTLGLLAGITRAIPIIGPIIGGIPIIGLALITKGFGVAVGVLIFFTLLHFIESKFVMPMIIGDRMNLHAVIIIVVLLIGGEFGGLLGMFFAPPIAAILRVIIQRYWLKRQQRAES